LLATPPPRNNLASALAQAALKDPLRFTLAGLTCEDNSAEMIEFAIDAAVATVERRKSWFNSRNRTDLRRPRYLAPLADGRYLPLNGDIAPLGFAYPHPYWRPAQFPDHAWEFAVDPRELKGVWRPHSPCGCGYTNGWAGMWWEFRQRGYGAALATVLRATVDPLRYLEMLFDDPPPPAEA
jgi:hypothetical protein